jgi:hypothetical protein
MNTMIIINTAMPYHWKEEYWPLYNGLCKARLTRKLTEDEKKVVEWFSYGITNKLFKDMV